MKNPDSNVNTGRDVAIAVHMGNQAAETEKTQFWKDEYSRYRDQLKIIYKWALGLKTDSYEKFR